MLTTIKFTSQDCGLCSKMKFYDSKVVEELGMEFIEVKIREASSYPVYFGILMSLYPGDAIMGMPTYVVCDLSGDKPEIVGEVRGGHPKGQFREQLKFAMAKPSTTKAEN